MKKWKKLVALALAAILAMSLLTACGGGGGPSLDSRIESIVISSVNSARSEGLPVLKSDATMKAKAASNLTKIKDGKVEVRYAAVLDDATGPDGEAALLVLEIPVKENLDIGETFGNRNMLVTPQEVDEAFAKEYAKEFTSVKSESDQWMMDSILSIGVATRTVGGKVYMAVAVIVG